MKQVKLIPLGLVFLSLFTMLACNQNRVSKVQTEHSVYRTGKTFRYVDRTTDSAMVFLEEVTNYNVGNASHDFTDLTIDSVAYELTISANDDTITGGDQHWIRDTIINRTNRYENRVNTDSMQDFDIIFVDIAGWSLDGNSLTFHGNIGIGDMDAAYLYADCDDPEPYTVDDDWVFSDVFNYTGLCKYQNSNAAREMEKRVNYKGSPLCRLSGCTSGQTEYYKNISTVPVKYDYYKNPNDQTPGDEYLDYYLWYSTWNYNTEPWACVYDDEMKFHTIGIEEVGALERPTNKAIVGYDVQVIFYEIGPSTMLGFHNLKITFGNIACKDV